MVNRRLCIFLYNRLFDPVIQSNFWLYISDLLGDPDRSVEITVVTYEDAEFPITDEQQELVEKWQAQGLRWRSLRWNPGTGLLAKFKDVLQGLFAIASLRLSGYRHVVSLASVAGTFVYLYSLLTGIRYFLYQYEPHSEYAIDNGMWEPDGLQFKISNFLERRAAFRARVISSGTSFMEKRLKEDWQVNATFFRIATVANDQKFQFDPVKRALVREELGLSESQPVMVYPGKFGDLYYREEVAWLFKWIGDDIPGFFFIVVTPNDPAVVAGYFRDAGVDPGAYHITQASYEQIDKYYSAADLGLIAVPPGPSKCFISNIKVGEYLCNGMPYIITEGVSDDYLFADSKNVGVVLSDFTEEEVRRAVGRISQLLSENKNDQRRRCRGFGLEYRGFQELNRTFRAALEELMA